MEAPEPRRQGPHESVEASSLVIQMHRLHCHFRAIQVVRKPRVHRAQRWQPEGTQPALKLHAVFIRQGTHQSVGRNHNYPTEIGLNFKGKKTFCLCVCFYNIFFNKFLQQSASPTPAEPASAKQNTSGASDPDVIELDDDEEEIDDEMKESNVSLEK